MPTAKAYNPSDATPYEAVAPPEMAQPMPSPISTQAPQANGAVRTSGAIATMADGVLRGIMAGKAYGQAKQVMQLKAKTDNLVTSYNQDAKHLHDLHAAGVPQDSPEYQNAMKAVNGSWGAYMDFMGQHVEQDKKPKKGNKVQQAGQSIMERLHSKDPMEQSKAWYEVARQAGPPIKYQLAQMNSPQAQAQQKAVQSQTQAQQVGAENQLTQQQLIKQRDDILAIPEGQRTGAQTAQLNSVTERLTPIAKQVPEKPGDEAKRAADGIFKKMQEDPNYTPTERDKMILHAAKFDVTSDSKVTVTSRGEIISTDKAGNFKVLRGPQREYENKAELYGPGEGRGGDKVKRGTPTQFSQVNKDTSVAYSKAKQDYTKAINAIDDAAANPKSKDAWPKERIEAEKKKAGDNLMEENQRIASLNSQRTRDLGGIPAEDSQHPAAEAHEPESTHGSDTDSNFVTQSFRGKKVRGMLAPGNLDITQRPNIDNGDGSHSSTFSMSSEFDGKEVLYPGVGDGTTYPLRKLTPAEAADQYKKTGKSFGSFKDASSATAYAKILHEDQAKYGNHGGKSKGVVRKAAFLHENPGATEADWNTMKVTLQKQGYEIKE